MKPRRLFIAMFLLVLTACSPAGAGTEFPPDEPTAVKVETIVPKSIPPTETAVLSTPAEKGSDSNTGEPEVSPEILAYIGLDSNVWLLDLLDMSSTQITTDGRSVFAFTQEESFTYESPAWSSDGGYLAFMRTKYTPHMEGVYVKESLWVYDTESGEVRFLYESENLTGFVWRPGTHQLTFADNIDPAYFSGRGSVQTSLAKGIFSVDADSGEIGELVKPQGYALVNPHWSKDGRFVSFEEVIFMEGRGNFAYYEIESGDYTRWDRPIGNYDWSPDSSLILHDNLIYVPNGEETIFLNNRMGTEEKVLLPGEENSYASKPELSPDGSLVAYRQASLLEEGPLDALMVLPLAGGQPRQLAELDEIAAFLWAADGNSLFVSHGPYETPEIARVSLESGAVAKLVDGWQPAIQTQ